VQRHVDEAMSAELKCREGLSGKKGGIGGRGGISVEKKFNLLLWGRRG